MSNKITFAKLHTGLFIPNAGGPGKSLNTKDTMPPESTHLKNLEMTYLDTGAILLSWDSENVRKRYIIGASNVAAVLLEPEKPKPAAVKSA